MIGLIIENDSKILDNELPDNLGFVQENGSKKATLRNIRNTIFHNNIWRNDSAIHFKDKRPNERYFHTEIMHNDFHELLPKLIEFIINW